MLAAVCLTFDGTSVRYSAGMIWSVSMFCGTCVPRRQLLAQINAPDTGNRSAPGRLLNGMRRMDTGRAREGWGWGRGGGVSMTHILRHVAFASDHPGAVSLSKRRCSEVPSPEMALCEHRCLTAMHRHVHGELLHPTKRSPRGAEIGYWAREALVLIVLADEAPPARAFLPSQIINKTLRGAASATLDTLVLFRTAAAGVAGESAGSVLPGPGVSPACREGRASCMVLLCCCNSHRCGPTAPPPATMAMPPCATLGPSAGTKSDKR